MTEIDKKLGELVTIVKKLRSPDGCEWDKQQTSETLIPYLLEEAYEVAESIIDNSSSGLKEELGDLLLHVVFQAVLAEEKDEFSINNVIVSINKKLIKRHPHVFDKDLLSKDVESIKKNWELNKKNEKNRNSILDGIPKSLPSLMASERLQDKAASVGFEWENYQDVINKIYEELEELKLGIKNKKSREKKSYSRLRKIRVTLGSGYTGSGYRDLKKNHCCPPVWIGVVKWDR